MIASPASIAEGGMARVEDRPRWDLTPLFPSLTSPELRAALDAVRTESDALLAFFEQRGIRRRPQEALDPGESELFDEVLDRVNTLFEAQIPVRSFISCSVSVNAADDVAQALAGELRTLSVQTNQIWTRFIAWIGTLDHAALGRQSAAAAAHAHPLRVAAEQARRQLSEEEELLCAELQPAGLSGWARLHSDLTSLLEAPVEYPDGARMLPMSVIRALANDPDRAVRRAAYTAELAAWERVSVPLAAALNGVKGWQSVLNRKRGYADDVKPTLLTNGIDAATLAAMQEAVIESFPRFRGYFRAKARCLGVEALAWYDLSAPVGRLGRTYSWDEATEFVAEQFGRYSARMRDFALSSFRSRWTDAEPRAGKEGGAYCIGVGGGNSRILMNFDGSINAVSTLAHELGHAYHNRNLQDRLYCQRRTPSTLAETASIFCETLVYDAVLKAAAGEQRLGLVEASLQRDALVVVDIHSRFLFEKAVFARRRQRELTPREFCELMLDAQRATFGDGLDPECLHPYMWAVKGHYYGPLFYNYPYTFGLLFGLGLYARYLEDADAFRDGYDDLLSATGLADAATLGARFGINTRSPDFWRQSLAVLGRSVDEFVRLAAP